MNVFPLNKGSFGESASAYSCIFHADPGSVLGGAIFVITQRLEASSSEAGGLGLASPTG